MFSDEGGMVRRILSVVAGIVVSVALAEVGLRLYFYENEAGRHYFAPHAFQLHERLPFHHAKSTTAWVGREGGFGPDAIATNPLGYRDTRVPSTDKGDTPRIMVGGASFLFGLGISRDQDLFHVQLERLLIERGLYPDTLEVYNIAQAGYLAREICDLADYELDRFDPDLVILAFRPHEPLQRGRFDIVNGTRLSPNRWFAGSLFDQLRSRSYIIRRWGLPFRQLYFLDLRKMADLVLLSAEARAQQKQHALQARVDGVADMLSELDNRLKSRGTRLVCMVIYRPDSERSDFGAALRRHGLDVLDIHPESAWCFPRDSHWNAHGHRAVATRMADFLMTHLPPKP